MLFKKTVWKNEQKQAGFNQGEHQNLTKPSDEQIGSHGCFPQKASPHVQEMN